MNDQFFDKVLARHEAEVAAGAHDALCEFEPGFYICNCAKRAREATGFTTAPTDDLDFPPPSCPRCDRYLSHDGDGWVCDPCHLAWDSNGAGSSVRFTDDHGDLTRCTTHQIRAHHVCTTKEGPQ